MVDLQAIALVILPLGAYLQGGRRGPDPLEAKKKKMKKSMWTLPFCLLIHRPLLCRIVNLKEISEKLRNVYQN